MVLTPSEKVSQTWDTFARNLDGSTKPMRNSRSGLPPCSGSPWPLIPSELTDYCKCEN